MGGMWLQTVRYGHLSVACAREGAGEPGSPVDPSRLMVRARSEEHLKSLQSRFESLQGLAVFESETADYRYRLFVAKAIWAEVVKEMVLETDYDNFKDAVARERPEDTGYLHALHRTWSTMMGLQE